MSVEKIPHMSANGASNTKGGGSVKGGHGVPKAGDANGPDEGFGALLSSLGADDAEPIAATTTSPSVTDDQSGIDANAVSNPLVVFGATIQVAAPLTQADGYSRVGDDGTKSVLMQLGEELGSDAGRLLSADALYPSAPAGTKAISRPLGQSNLSEMHDALDLGNLGGKAMRLLKERGRSESVSPIASVATSAGIQGDVGKLELRVDSNKVDMLAKGAAQFAAEVLPVEAGQQAEFRRDKAIFKANSTTAGSEASLANGADARPVGLSLEGMAPDVGAGMTQGDQNPGTYWMSSDMKNAEMKLDGFGESSVEVSISVHGNQAHVAFRTDEVQTRLALEDAGVTLKDMLSKEGLDLTGVSVSTSGAGGDGAQHHRPWQENRPTRTDSLASKFPPGASGSIVPSRVGQLDVFV